MKSCVSRTLALVFTLTVVLVGAEGAARAESRTHDGFVLQLSPGLGYYSMSADVLGTEQSYSGMTFSMSLLLGGTIIPGLHIGGGLFVDRSLSATYEVDGNEPAGTPDFSQLVLGIGPFVDYYINPSGGLHFQGFFGWGGVETATEGGGVGGSDPTGLVLYLGAGYDVFLSDEWSIGGMFRFAYGPFSLNDVDFPTIAPALLVNLTWS